MCMCVCFFPVSSLAFFSISSLSFHASCFIPSCRCANVTIPLVEMYESFPIYFERLPSTLGTYIIWKTMLYMHLSFLRQSALFPSLHASRFHAKHIHCGFAAAAAANRAFFIRPSSLWVSFSLPRSFIIIWENVGFHVGRTLLFCRFSCHCCFKSSVIVIQVRGYYTSLLFAYK